MKEKLLLAGGVVNALFVLFHLWLLRELYLAPGLTPEVHALLLMLNAGGTICILFFALAFLRYGAEVLGTGLGRLSLLCCALLYGTRALEEIVLAPRFSPPIFATCLLSAALFALVLVLSAGRRRGA